jgi:hypothetical protein
MQKYKTPVNVQVYMNPRTHSQLINFLQSELAIPANSIATALRHPEQNPSLLPMILWQYGLVTLEQLDQIFDWLEMA